MRAVALTSDKTSWILPAFIHQWDKYNGTILGDLVIAGYTPVELQRQVTFISIGAFADYPVDRWSDGAIKALSGMDDTLILVAMDDYLLTRPVDIQACRLAERYMLEHPDTIRFDLATDRMYDKHHELGSLDRIDLVEAEKDATYNLSFQASIWRRALLLEVLRPGETPWQSEILGTGRLNNTEYRVVGTRQWPMRYVVAVNKGKLDLTAAWMIPPRRLTWEDEQELISGGFIPAEKLQ
jgi:hypothetical protein